MDRGYEVSVVIPTYNRAEMLRAAIESVLAQTVPASQIVVVDDGSTDSTPDILAQLTEEGATITLVRQAHTNRRGEARNRGVLETGTPLVAFLDSDDVWLPTRLEHQIGRLTAMPQAGFAFCNLQRFENDPSRLDPPFLPPSRDYSGHILGELLEEALALSSTLLVKRVAFDRVGGFSQLPMNEDYELTLRLAAAYPANYLAEPLVLIREHAGRTSHSHGDRPLEDHLRIVSDFLATHPDLPPAVRARGNRGLANVNFKLARLYLERGDGNTARRYLHQLMRLRPWDRRAPAAYLRSWFTVR